MKNLIFVFMGLALYGCEQKECSINIDVALQIKYVNDADENLFELGDQGYDVNTINVYHKVNGEWKLNFNSNLDSPKGIDPIEMDGVTWLSVFPSTTIVENNRSETKIGFSATDADIIKTEIDHSNSNTVVTKVWYTDVRQEGRIFEIVK